MFPRGAAAVAVLLLAGCGGGEPAPPTGAAGAARVDAAKAANLTGRVLVEGPVPEDLPIRPGSDPYCMRETPRGARFDTVVVRDGGLDNVFVYVKDTFGGYHFDVPSEPVRMDQRGCLYRPHVVGLRAGQPIEFTNSDETLHNVRATGDNNRTFNVSQITRGHQNTTTFTTRDVMMRVKCDVHPWMSAWVGVVEHPYFAVTADGGRFELKNLPAGSYTVEAWHEKLGTQTQTVTLAEHESKSIGFTFRAPETTQSSR